MNNQYNYGYPASDPSYYNQDIDFYQNGNRTRQQGNSSFEETNPSYFMKAAGDVPSLLRDAEKISGRINNDTAHSKRVMEAAQRGQTEAVHAYLREIPLENRSAIWFNPDGLEITLSPRDLSNSSSSIVIAIRWREFI